MNEKPTLHPWVAWLKKNPSWIVFAALLPISFSGAHYFGIYASIVVIASIIFSISFEYIYQNITNQSLTLSDGTAALTGLLLALSVPASVPLHILAIGNFTAIIIAKQLLGGKGHTIFNPALTGVVFISISFSKSLRAWSIPLSGHPDALSGATPALFFKQSGAQALFEAFHGQAATYMKLLILPHGGCIGETSSLFLLAAVGFLIMTRILSWQISLSIIATVAVLGWCAGGRSGLFTGDPLLFLLTGGTLLGAFIYACDPHTAPAKPLGKLIYGIFIGSLAMLIRCKGNMEEGMMYAILIMNSLAPLMDRLSLRIETGFAGKKL